MDRASLQGMANLREVLQGWAARLMKTVGNSIELLKTRVFPLSPRYSAETQEELYMALRVIFDRAPTTVVAKVTRDLTRLAGQYGDER